MAPGKTVTIEVDARGSSADFYYVYVAPDATNPVWTLVGSRAASGAGFPFRLQTVLPEGTLEAVPDDQQLRKAARRQRVRYDGEDIDIDDMVFRVR